MDEQQTVTYTTIKHSRRDGDMEQQILTAGDLINILKQVHPDSTIGCFMKPKNGMNVDMDALYCYPTSIDVDGSNVTESPEDVHIMLDGFIDVIEYKEDEDK